MKDIKLIRIRYLELSRNNTESFADGNGVTREGKALCGQELLRNI